MLSALLDVDIMDESEFALLQEADPQHWWRWCKLVQIAKRANFGGCIVRSDLRPWTATDLAVYTRQLPLLEVWQAFLDQCILLGLLDEDKNTKSFRIVHWSRWHKPPSSESEETRKRKREQRLREREQNEGPESAGDDWEPKFANRQKCHEMSRDVTTSHDESRVSRDVTNVTTLTRSRVDHDHDQENQPSVLTRERPENTGEEGRLEGPGLNGYAVSSRSTSRISGHTTFTSSQNRFLEVIRKVYLAFMPGVYDGDQLAKACMDLCNRKSRWNEKFTEDDFCEGLRLATEAAKLEEQAGGTIQMLVPWVIKVASKTYFEQAHEWRQHNAKALARGRPPRPPLVPAEPTARKKAT